MFISLSTLGMVTGSLWLVKRSVFANEAASQHARNRYPCRPACAAGFVAHIVAQQRPLLHQRPCDETLSLIKNSPMKQIQTVRMAEIAHQLGVASSTISRCAAILVLVRNCAGGSARCSEISGLHAQSFSQCFDGQSPAPRRCRGGRCHCADHELRGREDWRKVRRFAAGNSRAFKGRARELGFRVEVFALGTTEAIWRGSPLLRARAIRGVLLGLRDESAGVTFDGEGFLRRWTQRGVLSSVTADRANFHGFFNVQLALDHMHRLGYRRPALVAPDLNNRGSNNLWSGAFLDWQRGLPKRDRCETLIPT